MLLRAIRLCWHLCSRCVPMAWPSEACRGSHSEMRTKVRNPIELANRGAPTIRLAVQLRDRKGQAVCRGWRVVGWHDYAEMHKSWRATDFQAPRSRLYNGIDVLL